MLKKTLSILLCAAMLASLLAGLSAGVSAEAETYTRKQLEQVISDTAIAYFLKGPDCQYDSSVLSGRAKARSGIFRLTFGVSPEECSPQRRFYTVCSSFPHEVYYNALGSHVLDPEDMVDTDLSSFSRAEELTGLPAGSVTQEDLEYPLSFTSLTASYGAYGKKIANGDTGWIGHDGVVYFWGNNSYETITDTELNDVLDHLRPGDIIAAVKGDEEADDGESGGHTMLYLGDYRGDGNRYIIHSGGTKYNNSDSSFSGSGGAIKEGVLTDTGTSSGNPIIGYDRVENYENTAYTNHTWRNRNGTILINKAIEDLGRGKSYGPESSGSSVIKQFVVMRPIDRLVGWTADPDDPDDDLFPASSTPLTPAAHARLQYPGLEISTVADKHYYNDVQAGEELTYTWLIENDTYQVAVRGRYSSGLYGREYSDLKLTLPLPSNVTYLGNTIGNESTTVDTPTVTFDGTNLVIDHFNITGTRVAETNRHGTKFQVDVTVRVSDSAQPGDKVTLPAGRLTGGDTDGYFTLAGMTHTVGGARPTGFDSITYSSVTGSGARTKMDAANDVYAAAGYRLELPDTNTFLNSVLTYTFQPLESIRRMQSRLLEPEEITDPDALLLRKMIVPEYIGGKKLFTPNAAGVKTNENRLRDFREDFLQPGDILVYAYTGANAENDARGISTAETDAERVYVYLGDSKYAYYDDVGAFQVISAPVRTFLFNSSAAKGEADSSFNRDGNNPSNYCRAEWSKVLTQAFRYSYFFCLRPSLAYTSLPTMTPSASAAYTVTTAGATTGYSSLASAITAANGSAGTLTMHEDATLAANQTFYGGTLDLGGHTLTTGAYSLTLGSGSSVQTLCNGTVTGNGDAVLCADSSATTIQNAKLFGGTSGAALASSASASVTLENVELASAKTDAIPVSTASSGTQTNWTFQNDVTVLVPSALVASYTGNGASLGTNARYQSAADAYYQISNASARSAYRAVTFTQNPTASNETKDIQYASLSDALAGAAAGNTILLLRDVHTASLREVGANSYGKVSNTNSNRAYAIGINKNLTIDFDEHMLWGDDASVGGTATLRLDGTGVTVTMKDGTIFAKSGSVVNQIAKTFNLDNMRIYANKTAVIISDATKIDRVLNAQNGSIIVGGLIGNYSATSNNAILLRHGTVRISGGSKIGSLTGIAIRPHANRASASAEDPNISNVIVEDGSLFTGRYAYTHEDSDCGYYDSTYDHTKNTFTLTFLSDSDPTQYMRLEHHEGIIEIPGSTAIIAEDLEVLRSGVAMNTTTGVQYSTLPEALAEAESGQTVALNCSFTMAENPTLPVAENEISEELSALTTTGNATLPAGVTLSLGAYTLTVPAGVTLDASAGTMTAGAAGGLVVAGTVNCSAIPANRIPDGQVRLETGGTYGNVTRPDADFGEVTVVPGLDMACTMSLNLNDKVVINHYLVDEEEAYTGSSFALVDGVGVPMTKEGTNWYLPVRESAAKEMGCESVVQPVGVDSAGVRHLGKANTLSIRWYAETALSGTNWSNAEDAKLGRTMIGMLNYGAAAQEYFGYQTGDLANKNLTAEDQARMTVYTPETLAQYRVNNRTIDDVDGIYIASSCVLDSSQALRFYLNLPESRTDREDLTFCVRYSNYSGLERTITKSFADLAETNLTGTYYFEVPDMAAADVLENVTLTVTASDSTIATMTDSIASYCARVYQSSPDVQELVDAMLIYDLSARDYFYELTPTLGENEMPIN